MCSALGIGGICSGAHRCYIDAVLEEPNRTRFERSIDDYIGKHGAPQTAVGLVDVNCFTEIVAQSGEEHAELLLRSVVRRLCEVFRGECVVGRIGTDTFGVVGGVGEISHTRLEEVRSRPFKVCGQESLVSVSVSIAHAVECEANGHAVLVAAALAMKTAKAKGYGGYAYYSRRLGGEARRRSELLEMLHAAVGRHELFLAYQPQISLEGGRVSGMEALLRWRLSNGELVSPEVFLPLAEQSGLAVTLGYQVMSWALQAGHRLRRRGFAGLRMAVNVSVPQFRDPEFVNTVERALMETNSNPQELELEITESVAALGEHHLLDVLAEIRKMGVGIAIDDFGTGYSSLAYADRLPADRLKVDRSFIRTLGSGLAESRIAKTIIRMGHELGWRVLAEGVETAEQLEALRRYGCDEVQGFYFAKPMEESALVQWLDGRRCVKLGTATA